MSSNQRCFLRTGALTILLAGVGSCTDARHVPDTGQSVTLRAQAGSAFVVRTDTAPGPWTLRQSIVLRVTDCGELTGSDCRLRWPLVIPVASVIHCRVSSDGGLWVSDDDATWITVGAFPLSAVAGSTVAEQPGKMDPVAFTVVQDADGASTIRATPDLSPWKNDRPPDE